MHQALRYSASVISILILSLLISSFDKGEPKSTLGNTVSDFKLRNVDGKMISLSNYPKAKGFIIVFTSNHCPFAKLYPERMNKLNTKYKALGVPLLALCSMDTLVYEEDSFGKMVKKAHDEKFNYPYLCDNMQTAAKDFGAQKTPHAFIIWNEKGKWIIKYSGSIDDNGKEPDKVQNRYVENAVDALIKGKNVEIKETKSVGCKIYFRK